MPPQCTWPQPSSGQVRLPAVPFPLDSKVEPFSGIPLVLPSGPAVGGLEGRLAGETTLRSRDLCTTRSCPHTCPAEPGVSSAASDPRRHRLGGRAGFGLVVLSGVGGCLAWICSRELATVGLLGTGPWPAVTRDCVGRFWGRGFSRLVVGRPGRSFGDAWSKGSDFILSSYLYSRHRSMPFAYVI